MKTNSQKTTLKEEISNFVLMSIESNKRITNKHLGTMIFNRFKLNISGAEIRDIIHDLRSAGHLVLADSKGYYIANDVNETLEYLESLKGRARSISVVANIMHTAAIKKFVTKQLF